VDTITNSTIRNLKELRPGTVRILFAFDPWRSSILLVAGDKAGRWNEWHDEVIPLAEKRYGIYLQSQGGRGGRRAMSGYSRWSDIRAEHVERAGGEAAVAEGKREILAEIEQGKISGQEVLARYATALGGRPHQAIYFDNGDITAIA